MTVLNNADQMFSGSEQVMGVYQGSDFIWGPFNDATGGTEATITNYNGSGETWKTHTFLSGTSTLNVSMALQPFRVLVVGGGGKGGFGVTGGGGGGGAGGVVDTTIAVSAGAHSVTVGGGGSGGRRNPSQSGQDSTVFGITAGGGRGGYENDPGAGRSPYGGASGSPQSNGGTGNSTTPGGGAGAGGSAGVAQGAGGGPGLSSVISGAAVDYARGGQAGHTNIWRGNTPPEPGSGGGGGYERDHDGGGGRSGIVIVAYQIG